MSLHEVLLYQSSIMVRILFFEDGYCCCTLTISFCGSGEGQCPWDFGTTLFIMCLASRHPIRIDETAYAPHYRQYSDLLIPLLPKLVLVLVLVLVE